METVTQPRDYKFENKSQAVTKLNIINVVSLKLEFPFPVPDNRARSQTLLAVDAFLLVYKNMLIEIQCPLVASARAYAAPHTEMSP